MEKMCVVCHKLIKEGERVEVLVRSTFHVLKSKIAYALDKEDLETVSGTMAHVSCTDDEDNHNEPLLPIDELAN